MKNRKYKNSLYLLLFALSIASCKKFVEIPPPTTELVTASVFSNNGTATSALTSIYTQMFNNSESYNMEQNTGLLSDELTNYATDIGDVQLYTNAMTANTPGVSPPGPWNNAYSYIYQANAVIAGLQQRSGVSPAVKQQLTGEAYFIRAFWHLYLSNCYGDVPLVTTTDYTVNEATTRSPRVQVLQQVVADLKNAQGLLNSNYVDGSDTLITTGRVRPNKSAASALMARVYLYLGDYSMDQSNYTNAAAQATAVINNSALYSLCPNVNNVFLANSTEAVWQLYTPLPANGLNTNDGFEFILVAAPANSGSGNSTTISPQLLGSFETGDQRKANWIDTISFTGITYSFPYKYKVYQSNSITEYTMMLRLAEQYLIRAEAEARLGNLSAAAADLNMIRNRAGLPNTTASTQTDLLTAILHERQVELFAEWGHRWFDLARTGNINTVMGAPGNVTQFKGGTWSSFKQLYPIPQSEILIDHNLTQNNGY